MEIKKIIFQVDDWPGYMICDIMSNVYTYYSDGKQSSREGFEDGNY